MGKVVVVVVVVVVMESNGICGFLQRREWPRWF
jgi:hypothetical protein